MMTNLQIQQHALMDRIEVDWKNGKSSVTVVEPTQDYASETRRCLTTVTFLPDGLIPAVFSKLIHPLRAVDPEQYYFSPDTLHVTIKTSVPFLTRRTSLLKTLNVFVMRLCRLCHLFPVPSPSWSFD